MPVEVTSVFDGRGRLQHVDKVALAGDLKEAVFNTKNYGEVIVRRGDTVRAGFLIQSEGFNVSYMIGGDQAAIVTFGMSPIIIDQKDVPALRKEVDTMLKQCNNATRKQVAATAS